MIRSLCSHLTMLSTAPITRDVRHAIFQLMVSNFGVKFAQKLLDDCFTMSSTVNMFDCRQDAGEYLNNAINEALSTWCDGR